MRPELKQHGFGLVAAMFLIIIVAAVIAAMARLAVTQNATNSLAIQQARAYQAARAGIERGLFTVTRPFKCGDPAPTAPAGSFAIDSFFVAISALSPAPLSGQDLPEEGTAKHYFYTVRATASNGNVGDPDYAYRRLEVVAEVSCTPEE
jgi:MSHA biogenesis protein MshP